MKRLMGLAAPVLLTAALCGALLLLGCGSGGFAGSGGRLRVVAAENFWGSIAAQLGGTKVDVQSIIVNPDSDPHGYEPTATDARAMAAAQMAIVNGVGYDEWATHLLDANPSDGRVVLDVGSSLGLRRGDNPHRWYSPADVQAVVNWIVAGYDKLRPSDKRYFAHRKDVFERAGLASYHVLIGQIRSRYAGVAVGYSESVFQPLSEALGLTAITPYGFAKAIAEGTEVSARDRQTVDRQASSRQMKVWVFNSQNLTPEVQHVNELARAAGIPLVAVTETLSPASAGFEQWQAAQLMRLREALHRATGR
jgi:zinc/manganese transport system substrate-binding protein